MPELMGPNERFHAARTNLEDAIRALDAVRRTLTVEACREPVPKGRWDEPFSINDGAAMVADAADALVAEVMSGGPDELQQQFSWCSCGGLRPCGKRLTGKEPF